MKHSGGTGTLSPNQNSVRNEEKIQTQDIFSVIKCFASTQLGKTATNLQHCHPRAADRQFPELLK